MVVWTRLHLAVAMALLALACGDSGRQPGRPSLTCQGCAVPVREAGEELLFEVAWQGTVEIADKRKRDTLTTCEPFRVDIRCDGAACETTRNHPDSDFWSLAQAAANEPRVGRCSNNDPEKFKVRPISGGELTLSVGLVNVETDETASYVAGPIEVIAPTIEPRADCGDCAGWDRLGVGVPLQIDVSWDGAANSLDPIGRQPFHLDLDCGGVACEARMLGTRYPPPYQPLHTIAVAAEPVFSGVRLELRATEPGPMKLTARLEHDETGEVATIELANIEHHRVDSIAVLCLGGSLCGEAGGSYDVARFGVVGVAADSHVLILPDTLSYSSNLVSDQHTSCSAMPYQGAEGVAGWSCETGLYAVEGHDHFTLHAEWMGLTAELRAPEL